MKRAAKSKRKNATKNVEQPSAERIPYGPALLKTLAARIGSTSDRITAAKFSLFRGVFPWFNEALAKTTWFKGKRETPEIRALYVRANNAWRELFGLSELSGGMVAEWNQAAAVACGCLPSEAAAKSINDVAFKMRQFAIERLAAQKKRQPAKPRGRPSKAERNIALAREYPLLGVSIAEFAKSKGMSRAAMSIALKDGENRIREGENQNPPARKNNRR